MVALEGRDRRSMVEAHSEKLGVVGGSEAIQVALLLRGCSGELVQVAKERVVRAWLVLWSWSGRLGSSEILRNLVTQSLKTWSFIFLLPSHNLLSSGSYRMRRALLLPLDPSHRQVWADEG